MSDRPSKVSSVKSAAELGTQRTIANRLRRASGQLAAVITAKTAETQDGLTIDELQKLFLMLA